MKDSRRAHHNEKVSTWLLTATVLLGLFAFSGYTCNTFSQAKEAPKTELVVLIKANAKRAASYTRAFARFHESSTRCGFCQSEINILWFHNRLFKTRIDHHSRQVYCPHQPVRFFQRKTFPQNSDEDVSPSHRG